MIDVKIEAMSDVEIEAVIDPLPPFTFCRPFSRFQTNLVKEKPMQPHNFFKHRRNA